VKNAAREIPENESRRDSGNSHEKKRQLLHSQPSLEPLPHNQKSKMAMDAAQLAQLIAAIPAGGGGSKKLHTLSSTVGSDWVTWKSHFTTVALINGWEEQRQKRELAAAMEGDAAKLVYDIDVEAAGIGNVEAVLTLYQARFLPAAAGRAAMVEFHAAQQRPDESTTQFHGRCREMFLRANPGQNVANSPQLIQAFALGLIDTDVSRFVLDQGPATFIEASNLAQTKTATEAALAMRHKNAGRSIHALNDQAEDTGVPRNKGTYAMRSRTGNRPRGVCFFCKKSGHMRRDCESYQKAVEGLDKANGGSGRTYHQKGNPRQQKKRISRIQDLHPEEAEDEDENEDRHQGNE